MFRYFDVVVKNKNIIEIFFRRKSNLKKQTNKQFKTYSDLIT